VSATSAEKTLESGMSKAIVPVEFSEDALALTLTAKYKDVLRYVAEWAMWMNWDGIVWRHENTLKVFDLARAVCREAANLPKATVPTKARLSESSTVAAVERMARSDRQFAATSDLWNADPLQLNTPGGVIDLASGKTLSHNLAHFHTKVTGTYRSSKKPELWLNFLDRVTGGDEDLQAYLQRVSGYCLTGSTQEHALFFFYGTGRQRLKRFHQHLGGNFGRLFENYAG